MSGLGEHGSMEKHVEGGNGVALGKRSDAHISDTQEHLEKTLEQKKYKEHTIDYWLNEVLGLPEEYNSSLEARGVDFNKRVTIKDLLNEIKLKDEKISLGTIPFIPFVEESLIGDYYDTFEEYLTDKNIQISGVVSVKDFLELLSGFDEERIQTIDDWAGDYLMHDVCIKFENYCERNGKKGENLICYSTYLRLFKGFQQEEKERNKFHSL